jgi:hypothetical protein
MSASQHAQHQFFDDPSFAHNDLRNVALHGPHDVPAALKRDLLAHQSTSRFSIYLQVRYLSLSRVL